MANSMVDKKPELPYLDSSIKERAWHVDIIDQGLSQLLKSKKLLLPNLKKSKSIAIFSDYSGELHSSSYNVYSFLICDYGSVEAFSEKTTKIRQQAKLNDPYKEMEFKSLRYGPINRAMSSWLEAADTTVLGLLINVVIDKKVDTLYSSKEEAKLIMDIMKQNEYSLWNKYSLEKVFRILHMIGYFYGVLSSEGANVFWMSDEDNIACNSDKKTDLLRMLKNVLDLYCKGKKIGKGGFATPFDEDITSKVKMTDLLSIADLSAGAICNYIDSKENTLAKPGRDLILQWIDSQSVFLKKITLAISQDENRKLSAGFCNFERQYGKLSTNEGIPIFL